MELDVASEPEALDAHHVVIVVATIKYGEVKRGKAFVCAEQATRLDILVATHRIPHHDDVLLGPLYFMIAVAVKSASW